MKCALNAALLWVLLASPVAAQDVRTQQWIRDGEVVEVFVDERGEIYRTLRYHGIIPAIRDHLGPEEKGKRPRVTRGRYANVSWVGFQQKQFYSRVFVQTDRLRRFTLTKPDPLHIVVTVHDARVRRKNDGIRPIITRQFNAAVDQVQTRRRGRDIEVTITLRKPVGYLYKQQGNYIFIDVER